MKMRKLYKSKVRSQKLKFYFTFYFCVLTFTLCAFVVGATAQTTEFVYQGQLQNAAAPANGNHDLEFLLFDQVAGGTQIGTTVPRNAVAVANGVFTVTLDFGATAFSGANRFLQINVRQTGGGAYTPLGPRTQILSTPYSTRALNATAADNLTTTGSGNYIQNTTTQQASSNFNVSGSGTVGSLVTNSTATFGGVAPPANAPAGQGRIYFDTASSKFRVSQNGNAFVDLVGSGGLTGSGNTNTIPMFSTATSFGNSVITQSGNNIGIGVAAPLHRIAFGGGPGWTTHFWGGSVDMENASAVGWRANAGGTRFGMGHTTDGFFMFRTAAELGSTAAVPIYDFKMDNAGNIGVGSIALNTDVSQARLNIFNLSLGYGMLNTLGGVSVGSYVDATGGGYGTRSNHPLNFFTNNALPQMTLSTGGHVGIGVTNPVAKLELFGTGWGSVQKITESTTGNSLVFQAGAGNNMKVTGYNYNTFTAVPIYISVDGANTILNSNGGNVGIGTSTPGSPLTVQTGSCGFCSGTGITHTNGTVSVGTYTDSNGGGVGTFSNNPLYFFTNNSGPQLTLLQNGTTKVKILQVTGGSDLAENFEMHDSTAKPGMVVAIDPNNAGKLTLTRGQYNRRVAGIISGANNLSTGMTLPDLKEGDKSMPVALSGRVWVYADASTGSIKPGDLLTSSSTPGHAMRVINHKRAQGAIIGKAMTKLDSGKGLVLVLVSLQ